MSTIPLQSNSKSPLDSIYVTRWSLIQRAKNLQGDDLAARRAINEVLAIYRPAILASIARQGLIPAEVEDACQVFLLDTFLRKTVPQADPDRGKFRNFLLTSIRTFVISYKRRIFAKKRGLYLTDSLEELAEADVEAFEEALGVEPEQEWYMEMDFAQCQHDAVIQTLKQGYRTPEALRKFALLSPWILEREKDDSLALSKSLGISPGATRQALSRLRKEYKAEFILRLECLLDHDEDVKIEMRHLLKLILQRGRLGQPPLKEQPPMPPATHSV